MTALILVAASIIVILLAIAIYYNILVFRKTRRDNRARIVLGEQLEKRKQENKRSIEIISRALIQEQVTVTEAGIRINVLSQSLDLNSTVREELSVFKQLAEATAHIPILDRWQALSKKEKKAFDIERERIEEDFHDFVLVVAKRIVEDELLDR